MTVGLSTETLGEAEQRFECLAAFHRLKEELRSAEDKAANLERALVTNRRIGIAIGILICQHQLTADQAFAVLKRCSQNRNVKVRELAETVIYAGTF